MKDDISTSHDIQLEPGDVAYIRMPGFEKGMKVAKTISLRDLAKGVQGSDLEIDFSEDGVLMGIEILAE